MPDLLSHVDTAIEVDVHQLPDDAEVLELLEEEVSRDACIQYDHIYLLKELDRLFNQASVRILCYFGLLALSFHRHVGLHRDHLAVYILAVAVVSDLEWLSRKSYTF